MRDHLIFFFPKAAALFTVFFLLQALAAPAELKSGYEKVSYLYDLSPTSASAMQEALPTTPALTVKFEDWHGYYDQYMKMYHVFPGNGTIPEESLKYDIFQMFGGMLENIEYQSKAEREGRINFGGILFSAIKLDIQFNGSVLNIDSAFQAMNSEAAATVSVRQGRLGVDAPIPQASYENAWEVAVVYPGRLIRSNAPAQDEEQGRLVWTSENFKGERIQFEIEAPVDFSRWMMRPEEVRRRKFDRRIGELFSLAPERRNAYMNKLTPWEQEELKSEIVRRRSETNQQKAN